ncbi:MAG TPA: hypothetical protein VMX94_02085 [Armatimonadota bacterium]|nr:hypothetical protein [Armatimonadota bacterium]
MPQRGEQLTSDLERARKLAIQGLFIAIVLFVLFEALRGQHFWNKIKGEGNLWNYGSSLLYFVAAEMAIVNAALLAYCEKLGLHSRRSWIWVLWGMVGLAFVYFACDEMLEVHEKMGLAIERAVPALKHYYSGRADNLIIAGYALGAVLFGFAFLRRMAASREARAYFISGFVVIALTSALDVVPRGLYIRYLPFRETEELLEVLAGFLFAAAFISSAAVMLAEIVRASFGAESSAVKAGGPGIGTRT